jgi:TolB-like protein
MAQVFLSYAREDRLCAERLARILEAAGHHVWWDRRLDGGEEFSAEIEIALDRADVVLVAWSKDSVKSRWVRDEAAAGGDSGRLMPVSIDGSRPPMGFRQFHTIDLTGWKDAKRDKRTAELLRSLDRRLNGTEVPPPASGVEKERRFAWPADKRLLAVVAMLVLVTTAGSGIFLFNDRPSPGRPLPKPTIALMPFTTASSDARLRDIAAQAQDSVSHALSQTGVPVRMLQSLPPDRRTAGDFLLTGEISGSGDKVVATIRLDEATSGVAVLSRRIKSTSEEIALLPERIGAQTASEFVGPNLMILDRRHPLDPALMAELLAPASDWVQAYQINKRAAAKAPDVAATQIGVAFSTGFMLGELPRAARPAAVAEARRAADRGLTLAPEFGDTHASWCLLHSEVWLADCEDRLRTGNRIDPDAPYLNSFLAGLLLNVGRFEESVEVTRLSYTHDPYDPYKIGAMLRALELAGDADGARQLYRQGISWWPESKTDFFLNRLIGLTYRADFNAIQRLEQEVGPDAFSPDFRASGPIATAVKSRSKTALRKACAGSEDYTLKARCMTAFAVIGDHDGAFDIAAIFYPRRVGRTTAETERIWLDSPDGRGPASLVLSPAAAPMRQDPRFLDLARRIGLLAYWQSGRAPDFCNKRREPICATLVR